MLLIDALDESENYGNNAIASLLSKQLDTLPAWLRVAVSSRPDHAFDRALKRHSPLRIECDAKENRQDIQAFVEVEVKRHTAGRGLDAVGILGITELIATKADGQFLYARRALDQLKETQSLTWRLEELQAAEDWQWVKHFFSWTSPKERRFLSSGQLNFCGVSAYPGSGLSSQSGMSRCIMSSENGSRNVSKRSAPGWGCSERNAVNRLGVPADAPLPFSSGSWLFVTQQPHWSRKAFQSAAWQITLPQASWPPPRSHA